MTLESDLVFSPFRLDLAQHQLGRGTERVSLRPKAFAVLCYLAAHAPRLVTPAELLQAVWADAYVSEGLLRSYMRELRVVLGDKAKSPQFIATVARRGWRFLAPVTTTPHPAHPPGTVDTARPLDPAAAPVPASPPEPMLHAAPARPAVPGIPGTHRTAPGEHKQVTVLVAGLKGVTTLAQSVDTEVLYEVLRPAVTLMQDTVERFAGVVIQCSGDRLLNQMLERMATGSYGGRVLGQRLSCLRVRRSLLDLSDHSVNRRHLRKAHSEHGQCDPLHLLGRDGPKAQIRQIQCRSPITQENYLVVTRERVTSR